MPAGTKQEQNASDRARIARPIRRTVHRFTETPNRSIFCFEAIPAGKPFTPFPGIALKASLR
ncbi:hypothetical protein NKH24_10465 [Mesorhizobium sp. M1300]|uniref:hypothetical protein n=1 Tax=Mesorhizobium sp. M1300 TaxID=2957077 RepID=UPI003338318B